VGRAKGGRTGAAQGFGARAEEREHHPAGTASLLLPFPPALSPVQASEALGSEESEIESDLYSSEEESPHMSLVQSWVSGVGARSLVLSCFPSLLLTFLPLPLMLHPSDSVHVHSLR
jgi:hypothetical protein